MAEDPAERLRTALAAFSRGDFDEALRFAHPDIEYRPPADAKPFRGVEALRAWMEPDAFSEQTVEPIAITQNGDKLLVEQRIRSRGAGSGIELEDRTWTVWTVDQDGRAIRIEAFLGSEREAALQAAGLS